MVDFRSAAIRGLAPDKGLYFPETLSVIPSSLIDNIESISNEEIALEVIRPYVGASIPESVLAGIVSETVNFPIPLVKLCDEIYSLELFHGPTLAFKDIGARFMSRCLGYFLKGESRKVTVLVATSGDTGGAVANGFLGVEGIEVVILYPSGKVSPVQEKQLTALGRNVKALEIKGSFDDCQKMVKEAFADEELNKHRFLTSANSINVARWLPQQFYYLFAWKQWPDKKVVPVVSVPSGNFGNICAGLLARQTGVPLGHFIAACNSNDVISGYLDSGVLEPRPAVPTLSNAMDVGNPSNFVRILEVFSHSFPEIKQQLSALEVSDAGTLATIRSIQEEHGYLADPHGAVGYLGLKQYLANNPGSKGFFLETAHPVKFPDAVESATGQRIDIPASLNLLMHAEKHSILMDPGYENLKDFLMNH